MSFSRREGVVISSIMRDYKAVLYEILRAGDLEEAQDAAWNVLNPDGPAPTTVYRILAPNGKTLYVGCTQRALERRFQEHRTAGNKRLREANPARIEAIERCATNQEGREREVWWYRWFSEFDGPLLQREPETQSST
jgi:predicted GIY-YIG superfamily endonuclease